ncbi:class I tRNA ligase family protein [Candidatus Uabimicrobium sp. HlEnr_7]|uniref:class I tRNA ligase family protein n=1 Tax=Candidatus Uabimicrobium helgolandensis TaxID=3095367 RepID=UPI003556F539
MQVLSYDKKKLDSAYGILCRSLHKELVGDFTPFGLTFCKVTPGTSTAPHSHHENETFLIAHGHGKIQINEEQQDVQAGDIIFIPAHSNHCLSNTTEQDLDFYSIYWTIAKNIDKDDAVQVVIPAPPTPNGPLHLGHLSGPYLAADVAHRANSLFNRKSFHVMGTDDNQSYVCAKANDENCSAQEITDRFCKRISKVIDDFNSDIYTFLHPTKDPEYPQFIASFYQQLKESGLAKISTRKAPCCKTTGNVLYGSSIEGLCPNCRELTGGNGCENCGHYNDAWDLIDAKSTIGEGDIEFVDVARTYIDLEEYRSFLESFINSISMPEVMRAFYRDYLDTKLPVVSLSQPASWGIKAPNEDGNVIYEWCEMAGGYLYLLEKINKQNAEIDFSAMKVNLTFGFDNAFFYGLLIPVLLKNSNVNFQAFLTNYFLHLDGEKFSTSRNHAIWGEDMLRKLSPDPLRLYLSLIRSELSTTDFQMTHFKSFFTNLKKWEELLEIINSQITNLPFVFSGNKSMSATEERFLFYFNRNCSEALSFYDAKNFRLNKVARYVVGIMEDFHDFYYTEFIGNKNSDISFLLLALRRFSVLLQPIMPSYSTKLQSSFQEKKCVVGEVEKSQGVVIKHFPTSFIKENSLLLKELENELV